MALIFSKEQKNSYFNEQKKNDYLSGYRDAGNDLIEDFIRAYTVDGNYKMEQSVTLKETVKALRMCKDYRFALKQKQLTGEKNDETRNNLD